MSKQKAIAAATKSYMEELVRRFPGLDLRAVSDSVGGSDVWIRIELPESMQDYFRDVLDATTELNESYWEERGIKVVATVRDKNALLLS